MANFFQNSPVPMTPFPEPQGYDFMRYLMMNRAMQNYNNPYGMSPQGAASWQGFNTGSRPFNPYANGMPQGAGGGSVGGAVGGATGGAPNIAALLQMLMSAAGNRQQAAPRPMPTTMASSMPQMQQGTMPMSGMGMSQQGTSPIAALLSSLAGSRTPTRSMG